jgi:hypothetical protein
LRVRGVIPTEKTVMDTGFNPERYGMTHCPVYKGSGRLFNGVEGRIVCKICGEFGFIKKEDVSLGLRSPWSFGVKVEA